MDNATKRTLSKETTTSLTATWRSAKEEQDMPVYAVKRKFIAFPADISIEGYKRLGRLYSFYTSYLAYVNAKLAFLSWNLRKSKMALRFERSKLLFMARGSFKAKQFAQVNTNEGVISMSDDILRQEAKVSMMKSFMWSIKGYLRAIDFEINRRKSTLQYEGKD